VKYPKIGLVLLQFPPELQIDGRQTKPGAHICGLQEAELRSRHSEKSGKRRLSDPKIISSDPLAGRVRQAGLA